MFRSDQQLAAVCQALCDRASSAYASYGPLWTAQGPTVAAMTLLRRNPHSHGEILLLQVAWALWNGRMRPNLYELVHVLDGRNLYAVGSLLAALALGAEAIDGWLKAQGGAEDCPACDGVGVQVDRATRIATDCRPCEGRGFVPNPPGSSTCGLTP